MIPFNLCQQETKLSLINDTVPIPIYGGDHIIDDKVLGGISQQLLQHGLHLGTVQDTIIIQIKVRKGFVTH
jgi:hypothetical protein